MPETEILGANIEVWVDIIFIAATLAALRSAATQSVGGFYADVFMRLTEHESLMETWIRGGNEPAQLKGIERGKFISIWNATILMDVNAEG